MEQEVFMKHKLRIPGVIASFAAWLMFIYELVFFTGQRTVPPTWWMHLSYDEWGKYTNGIYEMPDQKFESLHQIVNVLLIVLIIAAFITLIRKTNIKWAIISVVLGTAAYAPVFLFIRNRAVSFFIWMQLLPLVFIALSFLIFCILLNTQADK